MGRLYKSGHRLKTQTLLWRYFTQAFPGTTYSSADLTFRLGGKDMPYGRVELAYVGSGVIHWVNADLVTHILGAEWHRLLWVDH